MPVLHKNTPVMRTIQPSEVHLMRTKTTNNSTHDSSAKAHRAKSSTEGPLRFLVVICQDPDYEDLRKINLHSPSAGLI